MNINRAELLRMRGKQFDQISPTLMKKVAALLDFFKRVDVLLRLFCPAVG